MIRSSEQVISGQRLVTRLRHGEILSRVEETRSDANEKE
jgi:hypothetical protein